MHGTEVLVYMVQGTLKLTLLTPALSCAPTTYLLKQQRYKNEFSRWLNSYMKPPENIVQITGFLLVLHTYGLIRRVPQVQFLHPSAQEPSDEKEQNIGYELQ